MPFINGQFVAYTEEDVQRLYDEINSSFDKPPKGVDYYERLSRGEIDDDLPIVSSTSNPTICSLPPVVEKPQFPSVEEYASRYEFFRNRSAEFYCKRAERYDRASCIKEYKKYCSRVVEDAHTSPLVARRVNGKFVEGNASAIREYRLFYDNSSSTLVDHVMYDPQQHRNIEIREEYRILPEASFVDLKFKLSKTDLPITQAGPGCGKSHSLVEIAKKCENFSTIVLTSTKMSMTEISRKLPGYFVKTIDSFLINHSRTKTTADVLLIDEICMEHPGKIFLALSLSNAAICHGFGDVYQLGFANRHDIYLRHTDCLKAYPIACVLSVSYRLPADAARAISEYYEPTFGTLRTYSGVFNSIRVKPLSSLKSDDFFMSKALVYNQDSKREGYSTINEFQGREAKHVIIIDDLHKNSMILRSVPQAIVALSRHTRSLTLFSDNTESILYQMCRRVERMQAVEFSEYCEYSGGADLCLVPERVLFQHMVEELPIVNVPRLASTNIPEYWRDKPVLNIKSHSGPLQFKAGFHATLLVPENSSYTYSSLASLFSGYAEGRYVCFREGVFPRISATLVNRVLNRCGARGIRIVGNTNAFVPNEVADALIESGIVTTVMQESYFSEPVVIHVPDQAIEIPDVDDCVGTIQQFVTDCLNPLNVYTTTEFDAWEYHHTDVCFPEAQVIVNAIAEPYKELDFDFLKPNILTPCPRTQITTPRHLMNAVHKRNLNVPRLANVDNVFLQAERLASSFIDLCEGIDRSYITVTPEMVVDWLSNQPASVVKQLAGDVPLDQRALDVFSLLLKGEPKPDLTENCLDKYPCPQTILCSTKDVNMIFCPIIRVIRDRILDTLDDRFQFYTRVDEDAFANKMTRVFKPSDAACAYCYEFDMSKYDKSQGQIVLEFECNLMLKMGVDPYFVDLWRNSHAYSYARSRETGLKFETWFQRKSGDASTYFGNTCILMMALLDVIPKDSVRFAAFSGDDSLIFCDKPPGEIEFGLLSTRYNFEVKLFDFKYHYFCSKFVLSVDNRWVIVPDPLKRAVKLGRNDLRNYDHVEEYRISFKDNVKNYNDLRVLEELNLAFTERYSIYHDFTCAFAALYHVSAKEEFHALFYHNEGDRLCLDPSRPFLD